MKLINKKRDGKRFKIPQVRLGRTKNKRKKNSYKNAKTLNTPLFYTY